MVLLTGDEYLLKNKICYLQTQMRNFNRRISPAKRKQELDFLPEDTDRCWRTSLLTANMAVVKILVCIVWPFVFPTTVYCVEGYTPLFYSLSGVSFVLAVILAFTAVEGVRSRIQQTKIDLSYRIQELWDVIAKFVPVSKSSLNGDELSSSKIAAQLLSRFLIISSVLVLCVFAYICIIRSTSSRYFYFIFLVMGYICGLLTFFGYFSKSKDILPFRSPCNVKLQFTGPSPEKKHLDFTNFDLPYNEFLYELSPGYEQIINSPVDKIFY